MTDEMTLSSYLEQGGKLTGPANVPPRYRAELLKLMATFVDSELAGAAGFADMINAGPGIKERIAAARIVLEKTDNADRVLRLMGEFGADTARYASHHPWTARLPRDADIGTRRSEHDMRLAVFNYPLAGWADAVVMNLLMGCAVTVQLDELARVSYQPLADAFRAIAPVEAHHAELAEEGTERLMQTETAHRCRKALPTGGRASPPVSAPRTRRNSTRSTPWACVTPPTPRYAQSWETAAVPSAGHPRAGRPRA